MIDGHAGNPAEQKNERNEKDEQEGTERTEKRGISQSEELATDPGGITERSRRLRSADTYGNAVQTILHAEGGARNHISSF